MIELILTILLLVSTPIEEPQCPVNTILAEDGSCVNENFYK